YRRHDGEPSRRFLEPYRVVSWGQRWYLLAWDEGREDWRTFRVDRFDRVEGVGRRYRERALPDEDVTAYIAGNVARAGWKYRAGIVIEAPAEEVAAMIGPTYGTVEPIDAHRCRLEAGTDDLRMTAIYVA